MKALPEGSQGAACKAASLAAEGAMRQLNSASGARPRGMAQELPWWRGRLLSGPQAARL